MAPLGDSDCAMILGPMGEHTLDQPTKGQIVGMPFGAIFCSMSDDSIRPDMAIYARHSPDMPDVAQDTHVVDEPHM